MDTYRTVLFLHIVSLTIGIGAATSLALCLFNLRKAQTLADAVPWGAAAGRGRVHGGGARRLAMAYDEELAARIRELLAGEAGLTEKKMFGGLAFLIGGNMAVAASGPGGILLRVDPADSDLLVADGEASL